jgi:photosystem II stability/assembly factor-like uncharacterized protein
MKRSCSYAFFFLTLLSSNTFAQDFWQQTNGPYGGDVRSLAVSPNATGGTNLFAGTYGSGAFLSTNDGESWTAINSGLTTAKLDLSNGVVLSFAVAGINLFAATWGGGVFLSTNNGTSWTPVNSGLTIRYVRCLVISGKSLLAGTYGGVFLSTNNGTTWVPVNTGLADSNISCLAVSGRNVFAGTQSGGVFRTKDNGSSWVQINTGLSNSYVIALSVDSAGHIFAGTVGGYVFRSTDGGDSWVQVATGLTSNYIHSIAIDSGGTVFVGTDWFGVFRSTNSGESWIRANTGLSNGVIWSLVINPSGHVFAGTNGGGVFRSTDNGESWETVNTGLDNTYTLRFATTFNGQVFAGSYGAGVFRLEQDGSSWAQVNNGLTDPFVTALTPNRDGHIFAGTNGTFAGGVFRSTDYGETWRQLDIGLVNGLVNYLAVAPNGHIFASVWNKGVLLRSTDNGDHWTEVCRLGSPGGGGAIANNLRGQVFWAGGENGVLRSTDDGESWAQANNGLTDLVVLRLAVDSLGYIFAATWSGVFRSVDNGESWHRLDDPVLGSTRAAPVQSFSLNSRGYIFAASTSLGIFRSTNHGDTWVQVNNGLTNLNVLSIGIDSGGFIFAGTQGSGVFRSTVTTLPNSPSEFKVVSPVSRDTVSLIFPTRPIKFVWHESMDRDPGDSVRYRIRIISAKLDTAISGIKDTSLSLDIMGRLSVGTPIQWFVTATDGLFETFSDTARLFTSSYVVSVEGKKVDVLSVFALGQNYPNPFNPSTTIEFALPKSAYITLRVYDLLGRQVSELVNQNLSPGTYIRHWDARGLASGLYFYRLQAGEFVDTKKLLLLR